MTARGIRNNNPGNIRLSRTAWQGEAAEQNDPSFITFVTAEYGIRAIAIIMGTYFKHHGMNTVRQIISRWAPPVENDTGAYCAAVAAALGCGPDDPVDLSDKAAMAALIKAIIHHENGEQPYGDDVISQGIALAGHQA